MPLNSGDGGGSWESPGLQGEQTSLFWSSKMEVMGWPAGFMWCPANACWDKCTLVSPHSWKCKLVVVQLCPSRFGHFVNIFQAGSLILELRLTARITAQISCLFSPDYPTWWSMLQNLKACTLNYGTAGGLNKSTALSMEETTRHTITEDWQPCAVCWPFLCFEKEYQRVWWVGRKRGVTWGNYSCHILTYLLGR